MNPFTIGLAGGFMRSAAKTTAPQKGAHLARMRSLGLVGCIKDAPPDLAQNHKKYLRLALRAKYRAR